LLPLPNFCFFSQHEIKPEYAAKGLVMDIEKGNVMTLDANRRVLKAMHGLRPLSSSELQEIYPDPVSDFDGHPPNRFFTATSYFEAAPCALFMHLVALQDEKEGQAADYWNIAMSILSGFSHFMGDSKEKGSYYPELKANPQNYILKASPQLIDGLSHLKDSGKKIFLITNSSRDYTDTIMNYAFGNKYQEIFDVVVVNAKKPYFFNCELPFEGEDELDKDLEQKLVIGGGNAHHLLQAVYKHAVTLGQATLESLKCCFVGDNILSDIVAPKSAKWSTVAIVEELDHLYSDRYNKIWGSFFYDRTNPDDKKQTLWTNLIRNNADYCCESVEDLFRCIDDAPLLVDEVALSPCITFTRSCRGMKLLSKM